LDALSTVVAVRDRKYTHQSHQRVYTSHDYTKLLQASAPFHIEQELSITLVLHTTSDTTRNISAALPGDHY